MVLLLWIKSLLGEGGNLSSIFLSRLIVITSMMSNDWSTVEILCKHQHVILGSGDQIRAN